ncbi:MAG: SDR family oxidoreductase [Acidobacteria bacterium]|nr:SDR family oxidoreductase [Acidobacteriota bacterium]
MAAVESLIDFAGASVMVTGASSGIGRETAILLSRLNATVILCGRNQARLEETRTQLAGEGHSIESCDLADGDRILPWFRSVMARSGPLKAMVHAAGKQLTVPLKFVTPKAADDQWRTNLQSSIMLARGFAEKGAHAPESSMVFISSVLGLGGKPALSVYGASKAALIGLAKSLAMELAPERIRVNCVAPGYVRTEMLEEMSGLWSPEQFEALVKAHPLGLGAARDVANAIAFLAADTGRWITGTTLVVDGGYTAQ